MKLKLIAALLGLAIGGCAHSRSARLPEGPDSPPIGVDPVPSIHDTINRGTNPGVARSTLADPSNPNWSGSSQPDRPPATGLAPRVATTEPPANLRAAPEAFAPPPANPPAPLPTLETDVAAPPPATATAAPRIAEARGEAEPLPPVQEAADDPGLPPVREAVAPPAPMEEDPLLGPNPELMPSMGDLAPSGEAPAAPPADQPAPAPDPTPAPTPAPAPAPAPAAPAEPADAPALPDLSPAPAEDAGAGAGEALPDLPPAVEPSASTAPANQQSPMLVARSSAPRVDPALRRASAEAPPAPPADHVDDDPNLIEAGRTAARVGDEVITLRELVVAVRDQVARRGVKISQVPHDDLNMIAQTILAGLIERSLIVQEAKRQLKDKKQMDRILEAANKYWREEGLPPLLRQYMVDNEPALKEKLDGSGRSLEGKRQDYIQDFIAQIYVHQKLSGKMNVELPEMLKYYNQHVNDQDNQRSAQIVWRELIVETGRHPSPADARRKAEGLRTRLKAGEDFAKLAIAESEGPALVKSQGGLMKTSPGSSAVAAVNQALESLPPGEISEIIEGPSSLYIVRVESRRAAGPATFSEVQDQIRQRLAAEKMNGERNALLAKLRANTIITTIFDGTASDPRQAMNR